MLVEYVLMIGFVVAYILDDDSFGYSLIHVLANTFVMTILVLASYKDLRWTEVYGSAFMGLMSLYVEIGHYS